MGVMVGTSKHALRKLRDVPHGTFHIPKLKLDKAIVRQYELVGVSVPDFARRTCSLSYKKISKHDFA